MRRPNDYNQYYTMNILHKLQVEFHKAYMMKDPLLMRMILEDVVTELPSGVKAQARAIIDITKQNASKATKAAQVSDDLATAEKKEWVRVETMKLWHEAKDQIMNIIDKEGLLMCSAVGMAGVTID